MNQTECSIAYFLILVTFLSCAACKEKRDSSLQAKLENLTEVPIENYKDFSEPIGLTGGTIPVYNSHGKLLEGEEIYSMFMSGKFVPVAYMNDDMAIELFVFREASPDEKDIHRNLLVEDSLDNQFYKNEILRNGNLSFSAKDLYGNNINSELLKGNVVLLNFWFLSCKPCMEEIPELNKLVDDFNGKDFTVIGLTFDSREKVLEFIEQTDINYTIIPESKIIHAQFGINVYPTNILLSKSQEIAHISIGYTPEKNTELIERIESEFK